MQTFTLGGHTYTAPDRIGVGTMMLTESLIRDRFNTAFPDVPEDEYAELFRKWYDQWSASFDGVVMTLEMFLTPAEPTGPSVRDGFLGAAPDELKKALGFFTEGANMAAGTVKASPKRSAPTTSSSRAKRSSR